MKHFYSHLVKIDNLIYELDSLNFDEDQKKHLGELVDSIIHHRIMDLVLAKLSDEDKIALSQKIGSSSTHQEIWEFVNAKIDGVEIEIRQKIEQTSQEFIEDIKEAKKHG